MSEPTPEQSAAPDPGEQGNPDDATLGDAGKQALDRMKAERNEAKQVAASLKAELDKINAANLSDLERAQKAAQDAQETATKATSEALRYRIAAETGITENVDLILTASDEDTMRKQAALWGSRTSPTTAPGPRPDLSQGGQGTPGTGTPEQEFATFLGAQLKR